MQEKELQKLDILYKEVQIAKQKCHKRFERRTKILKILIILLTFSSFLTGCILMVSNILYTINCY